MTRSLESAYTVTGPPAGAAITSSIRFPEEDFTMSGAWNQSYIRIQNVTEGGLDTWRGTLMMTPLPVPSQSLLQETCSAVMRTKEKPSLPVPEQGRLGDGD